MWGVEDITHAIVGTQVHIQSERKGGELLENWLRRQVRPDLPLRLHEFETEGKHISILEIPRALHRPIQFNGQEYIRIGSYKKLLKDFPETERELWRLFDQTSFEASIAAGQVTSARVLELLDYPAYFRLLKLPMPDGRDAVLERLAADQLVVPTLDGLWNILNLGAVLFAYDLGVFDHLRRKKVRVIEYLGPSRIDPARKDEEFELGYAAGFERLIASINASLPTNEVMGQALRTSVPLYPELAIRELVANAVIHQDLTITGAGPMVEIFANRLEITNPGVSLVTPDRFVDMPPRSRNEALASFMRRIGVCEERGSGIDKVVALAEIFQLPAPLFRVVGENTQAVLFAHQPYQQMGREDRIRACYLHACLQYVRGEEMTNSTLRQRFGI